MAGYRPDAQPATEKWLSTKSGDSQRAVGRTRDLPPLHLYWATTNVFKDRRRACIRRMLTRKRSSTSFARLLHAAHTALIAGRGFAEHDAKTGPRVAIVNREFARKVFGSQSAALERYFKLQDGTRIEVVGIAEDGSYTVNLAEDRRPRMFLPLLQAPTSETWMVVRSEAIRAARKFDSGEGARNRSRLADVHANVE